jgi:BirA family biotin operon repressor/biotin-[acetyl-CoA-carboxylase] ligase
VAGRGTVAEAARPDAVVALDEVGSTNTVAFELAAKGEAGPLWVRARRQSQGRGRAGRAWTSVDGNLYASLLATLDCGPEVAHQLSLVAGVALIDAVRTAAAAAGVPAPDARLKWPNDGLIGRAKFAGILPESWSGADGKGLTVVIGVGINLAGRPAELGTAATHLAAHGLSVHPEHMLVHLGEALDAALRLWECGRGFGLIRRAWLDRAIAAGAEMSVNAGAGPAHGRFAGLDADGRLMLAGERGEMRAFSYGDVALAPAKEQPQ